VVLAGLAASSVVSLRRAEARLVAAYQAQAPLQAQRAAQRQQAAARAALSPAEQLARERQQFPSVQLPGSPSPSPPA
jgi:hypothetical protein